MINRREFLGTTAGAGAALTFPPELLRALQQSRGQLIQRAIPSTGEMLPVISYSPRPTATPAPGPILPAPGDVPAARAVLKVFLDNGGKMVDVLHGGPVGEQAARVAAQELGIQDRFFWTTPLAVQGPPLIPGHSGPPPKIDAAAVRATMEAKFAALKVNKIDLVMVGAGGDTATIFGVLREMKKEGRVRYIGAHDLATPPYPPQGAFDRLMAIMNTEQVDFVGTDYMAGWRGVEEKLLPLALEKKVAFMAYFPFDRGRVFRRIGDTPLPAWAAECDAKTWAQLLLKYVLGHPAVVVAREGTTKAEHMLDNIGGGIGRLPNEALRKRIADLVDSLPPTPAPAPPPQQPQAQRQMQQQPPEQAPGVALSAAILDRYVGEYRYEAVGTVVTFRRDGERLLMKSGVAPESPLAARSETRFQPGFPPGTTIEFELDATGKVLRAFWLLGPNRIPLEKK
jgi:aryl-alcohol dehydrogenase-like predicted oxidoreductase